MNPPKLKFLKICQDRDYFSQHHRVLLALSGGQDSITLFNWLYELREKLEIELAVAHVNHGVRAESDTEEQLIQKKMQQLGILFFSATFTGKFSENAAREFRYRHFAKVMQENGYDVLLTAHHKDDQAETVFMRLLTGRRLRHLTGIPERQPFATGELIRPILTFNKSELDASEFFDDKTNNENGHLRNRVRNLYLPELSQENPQFSSNLTALANEICRATRLIRQQIMELSVIEDKKVKLPIFRTQSEDLQFFILQEYLTGFSDLQLNKRQFDQLLTIIRRPEQYSERITAEYFFVKNSEEFHLTKSIGTWNLEIVAENPNDSNYLPVYLPADAKYSVRTRLPGDILRIHGLNKSLKKYFVDEKVSLERRAAPVIAVATEIYALPALRLTSDLSNALENATIKQIIWAKAREYKEIEHA